MLIIQLLFLFLHASSPRTCPIGQCYPLSLDDLKVAFYVELSEEHRNIYPPSHPSLNTSCVANIRVEHKSFFGGWKLEEQRQLLIYGEADEAQISFRFLGVQQHTQGRYFKQFEALRFAGAYDWKTRYDNGYLKNKLYQGELFYINKSQHKDVLYGETEALSHNYACVLDIIPGSFGY